MKEVNFRGRTGIRLKEKEDYIRKERTDDQNNKLDLEGCSQETDMNRGKALQEGVKTPLNH